MFERTKLLATITQTTVIMRHENPNTANTKPRKQRLKKLVPPVGGLKPGHHLQIGTIGKPHRLSQR